MKRPHFTYTLPEADQIAFNEQKIETITFVELTAVEEDVANRSGPREKSAENRFKASIKKVNGQPIGSGETDTFYNTLRPRQREFVAAAYVKLHGTSAEETASFLKSATVSVE